MEQFMTIGNYSAEAFDELVASFHGNTAPGVILGGIMVQAAIDRLPKGILYDAVCETRSCLPDAVQLLTPCTIGNGWLKILDLGRFALSLYNKFTGEGVRVYLDPQRTAAWPEVHKWYLKLAPKKEQDKELILTQIRQAADQLFGIETVRIKAPFLGKRHRGVMIICPLCKQAYPACDGGICRACQGDAPYEEGTDTAGLEAPALVAVPAEQSLGRHALHDMTEIIPGRDKGPRFIKDQVMGAGDLCRLHQMGRNNVYLAEDNAVGPEWVHENEATVAFARAMAGEGVDFATPPKEGKINLVAARPGLLMVEEARLTAFNIVPGVMAASRHGFSVVAQDRVVAGTRAIPLFLPRAAFEKAMALLADGPLFAIRPLAPLPVGILVTGTEVFLGLVEDRFIPIIQNKVEGFGCPVVQSIVVPDEREAIAQGVKDLLAAGAELIVTTAGLSVDPDDVTRQGLADAGATDLLYGAPILPGAMTLLARIGAVRVIGVPACALYFKRTSFDLILPRLLAGLTLTRQDLARFGHGAICLECQTCSFPKCPFGK